MPIVEPGDPTMVPITTVDPVRAVRLFTADLSDPPLVDDQTLADLLTMYGEDARYAAAHALEMVATSEVLISRKIRTQDLSTDGPSVAAALRSQAAHLRGQADAIAAAVADGEWAGLVIAS